MSILINPKSHILTSYEMFVKPDIFSVNMYPRVGFRVHLVCQAQEKPSVVSFLFIQTPNPLSYSEVLNYACFFFKKKLMMFFIKYVVDLFILSNIFVQCGWLIL